jgi:nucleoside-diphosphate-sugar epimerase
MSDSPVVVVTGANGFVGSHVCTALAARGVTVRAVVRRAGTAPVGVEEVVGAFDDPAVAAQVCAGASAVVTTVHPMGGGRAAQHRIGVDGTTRFARAARDAGVRRLVHVSTAGVYDRSPGVGDVDESSALVADDANDYAVTKRDADLALAEVDGITRMLVRPPAILGPGGSSTWNTLRPAEMRDHADERRAVPDQTFAWVHVDDLARFLAAAATAEIGPDTGCTPVNVCTGCATVRDYVETVSEALGLDPVWDDRPAWTGRVLADRARSWGWTPEVTFERALAELAAGLSGGLAG